MENVLFYYGMGAGIALTVFTYQVILPMFNKKTGKTGGPNDSTPVDRQ